MHQSRLAVVLVMDGVLTEDTHRQVVLQNAQQSLPAAVQYTSLLIEASLT